MLGGVPQILWGTNFESVIQFGYPLDSIVAGRKPRAGSEYVQSASGVEDAWIVGYDYEMTAAFRWIPDVTTTNPPATAWSGSTGVQAFLDYARAKNTFRFVPDGTNPLFYVDGCYVSDPMDTHGQLESDGTRNLQLTIRNPSVDFHQALRGIMFEYAPGASLTDPVTATFTRSGAIGPFVGVNGLEGNAATNTLRDRHYVGTPGLAPPNWGTRTTLIEALGTNIIENSDCEADIVGWVLQGGATIVRDNAQAFAGAWSCKITLANGAGSGCNLTPRAGGRLAAAAVTNYTFSAWVYAPTASVGKQIILQVDWWNVTPALISSSTATAVALVAGWQWLTFSATSPAATVTALPSLYGNTQGTPIIWVDVPQFEASAFATSAIPTVTAAQTRSGDSFNVPWTYVPQPMWAYVKLRDLAADVTSGANRPYLQFGNSGFTSPRAYMIRNNLSFSASTQDAAQAGTVSVGALAVGDTVEMLATWTADGKVTVRVSINGAADVVGSASPAGAFPAAFNLPTLFLTPSGIGGNEVALQRIMVGAGSTVNTIALARSA